jgi:proteic killer suppression protein
LQISFGKRRLQRTCEEFASLVSEHGTSCARRISVRLADLAAAPSLEEFRHLAGGCHELDGDRDGQLALDLLDGKRLILRPTDDPAPTADTGGMDWGVIEAVEIVDIVVDHD